MCVCRLYDACVFEVVVVVLVRFGKKKTRRSFHSMFPLDFLRVVVISFHKKKSTNHHQENFIIIINTTHVHDKIGFLIGDVGNRDPSFVDSLLDT